MVDRRLLNSTELFASLPDEMVEKLRSQAHDRQLVKGELLFGQGDESSELYVVMEGRTPISTRSSDGRESMVAVLENGGLFGEMGLFDGGPRSAEARALSDTTLIEVSFDDVRAAVQERPEVLWAIVRLLAQRIRATDEALADAVFLDVPARTAKRLLELAGDADEFQLPMTQEDLAGLVGASRERVNKAIAMFVRLDWVAATGRSRYRILDREQLELARQPLIRGWRRSVDAEKVQHPIPGVGGVVGAMRRPIGVVDESVLGILVHHDLAVVAAGPRLAQRIDVRRRRVRVGRAEDRERRAHVGDPRERFRLPRSPPGLGESDHSVERDRPIETVGRRGLECVHATHAEAEDRNVADVVVDDQVVGRQFEITDLALVVERCDGRHTSIEIAQIHTRPLPAPERLRTEHGDAVAREAAGQVLEQRANPADVGVHHQPYATAYRRDGHETPESDRRRTRAA